MTNLLETSDLGVRIAAGESLALMYEMARDINKDFIGDSNGLCDLLRDLATDGTKHKAKKDLRQQRSSFRDILKTVEVYCKLLLTSNQVLVRLQSGEIHAKCENVLVPKA